MPKLTRNQLNAARVKIQSYYDLDRDITEQEAIEEIASIQRRYKEGSLGDMLLGLKNKLASNPHPIIFEPAS